MREIKCDNCGEKMEMCPSEIGEHNFCDLKCYGAWKKDKKSVEVDCENCGKTFSKLKSIVNDHNFCSRKCSGEWHRKDRVELNCDWCGDEFHKIESQVREHNFCSKECNNKWISDNKNTEICAWCGKEFRVPPKEVKENNFCCHEHYAKWLEGRYTGEDHPNYTSKIVYCKYCGAPIKRPKWHREQTEKGNFCDHECYSKSLESGKVLTSCMNCGKDILLTSYRYLEYNNNFCSKKCSDEWHTGRNAPAWKGGRRPDFYGPNWRKQRQKVLERDNHICQLCGKKENTRELDVHHKKPFRKFEVDDVNKDADVIERFDWESANRMSNLISLCQSCHRKIEEGTASLGDLLSSL